MMRCLHVGLLVMLTCLAPIPRVDAQPAEREAVLKARETALLARDVGAVLPLFADDALVVTSSGRFLTGRGQIKTGVQDRGGGANERKQVLATCKGRNSPGPARCIETMGSG